MEKYKSGKLKSRWSISTIDSKKFVKHGKFETWYENGKPHIGTEYSEGHLHGIYREFYPDSALSSEGYYQNEKKQGPWNTWYENQKIKSQAFYHNGKLDRAFSSWYPNGMKKRKCTYQNDTLNGLFQVWYPNGQPKEMIMFKMGKREGESKFFYTSGQLSKLVNWKNDSAHGQAKAWYESGKLKSIEQFHQDLRSGPMKVFYDEGKRFIQANFIQGRLQGDFFWWAKNGKPISQRKYQDGLLISDSRINQIQKTMDAEDINLPMHIGGFIWGMSPDEVMANTIILEGTIISRSDSILTCRLPRLDGRRNSVSKAAFLFNSWMELCDMEFNFPNSEGNQFSYFTDIIEKQLNTKLSMPVFSRNLIDIPGILEAGRTWGVFFIAQPDFPEIENEFPVITAALYSFEDKNQITFHLRNNLIRKYADKSGTLRGPFYTIAK